VRIALVFPLFLSHKLASYQDNGRFLGNVPPLSLLYVASALKSAGATVRLWDCPALGLSLDDVIEAVRSFAPDYVGFTLTTVDWGSSLEWMERFHGALGVPVVVGGVHMECYPAETLTHDCIALGFIGPADLGAARLLEVHAAGGDLRAVPGAVFRDEEQVVVVPPPTQPRTDAGMPLPARELIDNRRYFTIVSQRRNFTAAMSNFGCPYGCEFCILRASPVRQRSAASVAREMEICYRDHGVREMDFFDPVFTLRRPRVFEICAEIKRRNLKGLIWSIRARTDTIDEELLDVMWDAGCRRIYYGIEGGSPEIRGRVDKRLVSNAHIAQVLAATRARGYEVLAFVMIGNPLEDHTSVRMTRNLLRDSAIDLIQVASLFPLPRTPIYREIVARTGRDYWREHVLHGASIHPVERLDTGLSDDEIRRMVTETYLSFYFRPTFVAYALKRARRPEHLWRGLRAAAGVGQTFLASARQRQG